MKHFPRAKGSEFPVWQGSLGAKHNDGQKTPLRHIIVKFQNPGDKKKILKASRDTNKVGFNKGSAIKIASDGSIKHQKLEENRGRYQNPEAKWFQPRILYSVQLPIKCWKEVKPFLEKKVYFSWNEARRRMTRDSGGPSQDRGEGHTPKRMKNGSTQASWSVPEGGLRGEMKWVGTRIAWCVEILKGC